eukprot:c13163_g3_i2.p1 GENE.c13163_g3_i2~~c13163_g3_i2.p1  ORF type:complete len:635 (-),score=150.27 c13163_g3_i2:462-2366(-)
MRHLVFQATASSVAQEIYNDLGKFNGYIAKAVEFDSYPLSPEECSVNRIGELGGTLATLEFIATLFRLNTRQQSLTIQQATELVEKFVQTHERQPLLFIDETPVAEGKHTKTISFLRNLCRVIGVLPVLMGTDSTLANIVVTNAHSRGSEGELWCRVIVDLPATLAENFPITFVSKASFKRFLTQEIKSVRPWLAHLMARWIQSNKELLQDPEKSDSDLLDSLREFVAGKVFTSKPSMLQSTRPQVCFFLAMYFFGQSTLGLMPDKYRLITSHFADLVVDRNHPASRNDMDLEFSSLGLMTCTQKMFAPLSKFRTAKEECLPHLALTGTPNFPAFQMRTKHDENLHRVTARIAYNCAISESNEPDLGNPLARQRDGNYLEALFAMAACVASHCNGVRGCSLDDFLRGFMSELQATKYVASREFDQGGAYSVIKQFQECNSSFKIPYLSLPNNAWPQHLLDLAGTCFGELCRPQNTAKCDLLVGTDVQMTGGLAFAEISGEAKHRNELKLEVMQQILTFACGKYFTNKKQSGKVRRVSTTKAQRKVHLVISETIQQGYFCNADGDAKQKEFFRKHKFFNTAIAKLVLTENDKIAVQEIKGLHLYFGEDGESTTFQPSKHKVQHLVLFVPLLPERD